MLLRFLLFAQVVMQGLLDLQSTGRIFVQVVELPLQILGFLIDLGHKGQAFLFIGDVVLNALELLVLAVDLRSHQLVGVLPVVLGQLLRNLADLRSQRRLVQLLDLLLVNSVLQPFGSASFPHYLISNKLLDVPDLALIEVLRGHIRHFQSQLLLFQLLFLLRLVLEVPPPFGILDTPLHDRWHPLFGL